VRDETAELIVLIWGNREGNCFLGKGWTRQITLNWLGKLAFWRNVRGSEHDSRFATSYQHSGHGRNYYWLDPVANDPGTDVLPAELTMPVLRHDRIPQGHDFGRFRVADRQLTHRRLHHDQLRLGIDEKSLSTNTQHKEHPPLSRQ
jgi:hypothetical protein